MSNGYSGQELTSWSSSSCYFEYKRHEQVIVSELARVTVTLCGMSTVLVGVGAIAAALVGRQLIKRAGRGAADQWAKGGFRAKMDRKEALAILGLKQVAHLDESSEF